jgi:hypothetical protein
LLKAPQVLPALTAFASMFSSIQVCFRRLQGPVLTRPQDLLLLLQCLSKMRLTSPSATKSKCSALYFFKINPSACFKSFSRPLSHANVRHHETRPGAR